MLFKVWLSLAELVEYYDFAMENGRKQDTVNRRADAIAAFRTVEQEIGIDQSIPRRVR